MADFRLLDDETADTVGVIRTRDSKILRPSSTDPEWAEYVNFKAAGGSADAANVTAIATLRDRKKRELDRECDNVLANYTRVRNAGSGLSSIAFLKLLLEAIAMEADGSPSAGAYPCVNALPASFGASLALKGASVRTYWTSIAAPFASSAAKLFAGYVEVNGADDKAAVDAVSVTWTTASEVD